MSFSDLARRNEEFSAFLEACPVYTNSIVNMDPSTVPVLLSSVPKLRALIESNGNYCTQSYRQLLERCLYDMVTDGQPLEAFVEFGLWILDNCISQGQDIFFAKLDSGRITDFLENEAFRYSIVHKPNGMALIRSQEHTFCEKEWCGQEGILLCSRCLNSVNRRVAYCSRDCQLSHWATHRRICGQKTVDMVSVCEHNTGDDAVHLLDYNLSNC